MNLDEVISKVVQRNGGCMVLQPVKVAHYPNWAALTNNRNAMAGTASMNAARDAPDGVP